MRKKVTLVGLIAGALCLLPVLSSAPCAAAAGNKELDFGGVVKMIEAHYRVKSKGLPWIARMSIKAARPVTHFAGYGNVKVAIFEDQDFSSPAGGVDFGFRMRDVLRPTWNPLVEVRSRKSSEQTYVYTREAGERFKVLVVTLGQRDGTAVQVDLSAKKLAELMRDPEQISRKIADDATTEPAEQ